MAVVFASLAVLSVALGIWQWLAAWRFPLHQRAGNTAFAPAITLLKPLKGCDTNTAQCLESWLAQDYAGPVQILFGIASADDPACGIVRELMARHPKAGAQLVVCPEKLGANAKVSTLIQLLRLAQNGVIVVSDADVLAPRDFLANLVAPLQDPGVGLVNCFYRAASYSTLAMRWEAVAINADFWSQVLQSRTLQPLDFALGAVMATRREDLAGIGGLEALADYLADDFQLGNRIARRGKRIALCSVVVDCLTPPMDWKGAWTHQLRWARTIRVCKPWPYGLSILSNATLWPLLWLLWAPSVMATGVLVGCLAIRIITAQLLQRRLGPVDGQGWFWWLAPIKDLLQFGIWIGAFFGNDIEWRGERFHLERDGRLLKIPAVSPATDTLPT
ncbi:MAG TPA: bacteriohopanetetrol glucosamine biosynthesis glycosyltransferase HpnI [Verrucomicrobiae bacterium]|nr:bacteriohopanetetrol glucosamine biosynthesis glycosyltransferase HpnI [Verrucomicrobiae bacterium]